MLPPPTLAACALFACALSFTALPSPALGQAPLADPGADAVARVLVFSKTTGFRHASIPTGVEAVRTLGQEHGWRSDWTEDAARFSDEGLAPYAAVVFMSTTQDVLDSTQQAAFERYIQGGKGYVGVHAAADTEYDWAWYRGLVGRQFVAHPAHQRGTVYPIENDLGGLTGFGDSLTLYEEWYAYSDENADGLHYLMRLDEASYSPGPTYKKTNGMGDFHPLSWYHAYDGGRSFYTGIGHMDSTYHVPAFRDHLATGIHWAITGEEGALTAKPVGGVATVIYRVADLAAAKTWYTAAFGQEPYYDQDGYVGFDIGGFELGLVPNEDGPASAKTRDAASAKTGAATAQPGATVAYWRVDDVDAQYRRLLDAGAIAHEPPTDQGGGVTTASVHDPDGNVVGLIHNPTFRG